MKEADGFLVCRWDFDREEKRCDTVAANGETNQSNWVKTLYKQHVVGIGIKLYDVVSFSRN